MEGPSLVVNQMWFKSGEIVHFQIFHDYFAEHPIYDDHLFMFILNALPIVLTNRGENMCT
jgi:hypothetical protein